MPQLGLGTEIGRVSGGAYDSDALAYFARAGIASGTQTPSSSSAVNRIKWSQKFADPSWFITTGASVLSSTNSPPAPYPGTGDTLRGATGTTASGDLNGLYQIVNVSSSTQYTFSVWARSLGSTKVEIRLRDTVNGASPQTLVGSGLSSNWTRLSVTLTTGATTTAIRPVIQNTDGDIAIFGAQVELGSSATSYIYTEADPNFGVAAWTDSRRLISDFVRGIKSLGLWNSMVCWPLRSSQNASTTLTARSLGGLGTFDGSLFGLATSAWGANGLAISNPSLSSDNQRVDLPAGIGTSGANIYSYGAGMITSGVNFNRIIHIENASANSRNPLFAYGFQSPTQFLQCDLISGTNTQVSALQTNATIPLNTFGSTTAGVDGNTLTVYNNTTTGPTATSPGGWNAAPGDVTRTIGRYYNGTLSMVVIGRFGASASLVTSLNNLYKQTLLLGLGLP